MFVATVACSVLLAGVMTASAVQVVTRQPATIALLERVRADRLAPAIALSSAAGAVGLVAGLVVAPVGIVAATGVLGLMLAATCAHLRVRDRNIAPAAIIGALAAVTALLRVVT